MIHQKFLLAHAQSGLNVSRDWQPPLKLGDIQKYHQGDIPNFQTSRPIQLISLRFKFRKRFMVVTVGV